MTWLQLHRFWWKPGKRGVNLLLIFISANTQVFLENHNIEVMVPCGCGWSKFSLDHLLVAVQSLLGHILDESGIFQLQLSRNRHDQRGRVEDVDLHLGFSQRHVLFFLTLWLHLEDICYIHLCILQFHSLF